MHLVRLLSNNLGVVLLFLISGLVCFLNYSPNTFLTGWDTLHPEFDLILNLKRVIFGVWRQEQGLGALSVHAHMSELPRILLLWVFSAILPLDFLRYFYIFVSVFIGPLGVYYFLRKFIHTDGNKKQSEIASFLGGLFYLLNLGTVQHFFVPFEMFTTLYASLPWFLYLSALYLKTSKRKYLILFLAVTFVSLSIAYAPTLWHASFLSTLLYLLGFVLKASSKKVLFKRFLILLVSTILINSYWLFPHLYQAFTANQVPQAKINEMFSENAFEHDKAYANIFDALILKSFLFDWEEFRGDSFINLMEAWNKHINNPFINTIGLLLSFLIIYGAIKTFKNSPLRLPIGLLFSIPLIVLLHGVFPISLAFSWARDSFELLKEGFRFPWTKFSLIVIFCYSIFFSNSCLLIYNEIKNKIFRYLFLFALLSVLVVWIFPIFKGNFISKSVRINIPQEYFELYSWFKTQDENTKIGVFPEFSYWGWDYNKWGFQGAGFLWFGLNQSVLVRDFDRWNPNNENFYWETSYALESENLNLFEKTLEKYQISWLVVDKSIINPSFPNSQIEKIDNLILESGKIKKAWSLGFLNVYKIDLKEPLKNNVYIAQNLPSIYPQYKWDNFDLAYFNFGNYQSSFKPDFSKPHVLFPFRSIFTNKNQEDYEVSIEEFEKKFIFKATLPSFYANLNKKFNNIQDNQLLLVDENNLAQVKKLNVNVSITDSTVLVETPMVEGYFGKTINIADLKIQKHEFVNAIESCNKNKKTNVKNEIIESQNKKFLRLKAENANNCSLAIKFPNLSHSLGYLISIETRNKKGRTPLFWLENLELKKSDLEFYLPINKNWDKYYFIQAPAKNDGLGYTIHVDNISIHNEAVNDIGLVTITPLPYNFLKNFYLKTGEFLSDSSLLPAAQVKHPNPSLYLVETDEKGTLVLSQSFNNGWKAYLINDKLQMLNDKWGLLAPIFGKEIKEHVLVNNWENGWVLGSEQDNKKTENNIVIIFLPQYLEYLGFVLAGGMLIYIVFFHKNEKN